ncbi:hypothetical protein ABIB40_000902 [Pedobacter sp. UYP30]|uniref:porin family protein n=1 Tax=Pedobacter sp. UYP30 TaxID=1756400 RepID=UPI0033914098
MKKLTLLMAMVAAFAVNTQAQTFNLGIKAGVNLAKIDADYAKTENRLGYQLGAWARVGVASFYIQPEAYIGTKDNRFLSFQNNGNEVTAVGTAKFTTLDVPVLFGTSIGSKNLNFRLMAGPAITLLLNDRSTFSSAYDELKDFKSYKKQAFSIQAGAGVDILKFSVDLRYVAGLSNLSNSDMYKQKSNVFQLSLGYKIL